MLRSMTSSCYFELFKYNYTKTNAVPSPSDAKFLTINKGIKSYDYSKNIGIAAGDFTIEMTAEMNWKSVVFPGDWILVYLSNDGIFYPRMLGNVDRVTQFSSKNDKGLLETSYVILGKDFGKVFEKTNIWFNAIDPLQLILKTETLWGMPNELIDKLLDIFLAGMTNTKLDLQPQFNQWYIPYALARKINREGTSVNIFENILKRDLQDVSGFKAIEDLEQFRGICGIF